MCGIYGLIDLINPVDPSALQRQSTRLAHRGPDDAGTWLSIDRSVGLAQRRLAIIDLSAAGHQPMSSADGRYTIVYNGEVYNFKELRRELEAAGHCFAGGSDTEVVLAAYQAWGEQCVSRFNGMFALAIYDRGTDNWPPSLFLARDRAGKKPLYYCHDGRRFQFASELKAIEGAYALNETALNHYLALGYIPHNLCIAARVHKLPPAHIARLTLPDLRLALQRYWELPVNNPLPSEDGEFFADQAQTLLEDAVRLRLISDVPLGVLLSGGLDSSLVVAAAARQSSDSVKTFTIAMTGSPLDESSHARVVADHFATEHHVLETSSPTLSVVNELAPFVDEPLADSSIIPSFLVSRLTRQYVTVALGGDGGDELFGGYLDYPVSLADQQRFGSLPRPLLRAAALLAARLPAGLKGRNRLASLRGGPLQQMIWGSPYFDLELRGRILTSDTVHRLCGVFDEPEQWLLRLFEGGRDAVDCMTRTHFGSILPDDFLVKVDRSSMAHSLELRTPFLDYRLVEFAFGQIPSCWKVQGGATRRIQRILGRRMLPPALDTGRKQGFSIPLDDWLRTDRCYMVRQYLPWLPACIERREVERLIDGHSKGRANGSRLFALLMLAIAAKNNGWS